MGVFNHRGPYYSNN